MVCIVCLHSYVVLTSQKHRNRKQTVVSSAQGREKWEVVQKCSFSFTSFCPSDGNRDNTTDLPRHDEGMKKGQSPRNRIAESRQAQLILLEWKEQGYKLELPWFIMYTKRKRGWLANSEGALCGGGEQSPVIREEEAAVVFSYTAQPCKHLGFASSHGSRAMFLGERLCLVPCVWGIESCQ